MRHHPTLEFRLGSAGAVAPLVVFLAGVGWLGFSGAPDERGLWPVLLGALGLGLALCRDPGAYATAVLEGMSRRIVALMVMAWLLAGVFSVVLRESGLIHSLIWIGGELGLSGGTFALASFLLAVLFATVTGTSLGTLLVCAPLLYPASAVLDARPEMIIGAVLAGATFGDNVSPVSDTTIASATSQEAAMGGVVRSRLRYALPAAGVSIIVFLLFGGTGEALAAEPGRLATGAHPAQLSGDPAALPMLVAPLVVFAMLWRRQGLLESLFAGVAAAVAMAVALGLVAPAGLLFVDPDAFRARGLIVDGMESAIGIVVFTILLMGLLGGIEGSGIVDRVLSRSAATLSPRGAELRMFAAVSTAVLLTTHSVVAILAAGPVVRRLGEAGGIGRYRRANILDTTVCTYPFLLPFFIPTILAASTTRSGEAFGVSPTTALDAGLRNAYSWALLAVVVIAILSGWGRRDSAVSSGPVSGAPDERTSSA